VVIGLFGFVSSNAGMGAPQTSLAVTGIAFTYCGVNMLIYLASILAIHRFAAKARPVLVQA
jgi:hypothetical protein